MKNKSIFAILFFLSIIASGVLSVEFLKTVTLKKKAKTVAPLTEEQKEIQNEFNEKRVSMDTNEIHIDNHEIDVNNEVWFHRSSCKECLKRQGF